MNTTKTLMLAAFAALSLGAGSAMAQEGGGPSMPTIDFWQAKALVAEHAQAASPNTVQSGSSDTDTRSSGTVSPFDYGTLANPG